MINCVSDSRSNTGNSNLPNASSAYGIADIVRLIDKRYIDVRDIGIHGNSVVGKVVGYHASVFLVVDGVLQQSHSDAPSNTTESLTPRRLRIDHAPDVEDAHMPRDPHFPGFRIHAHFTEL